MASKTNSFTTLVFLLIALIAGSANASPPVILVMGDSLSAAYGMPLEKGWVYLTQKRLQSRARLINASISGETTAGAAHNLPGLLQKYQPRIVILAIGANDGLRGHLPATIFMNLATMIEQSHQAGSAVILTGIDIPSNYGPAYREAFRSVYTKLAADYDIVFMASLFDEIYSRPDLLQGDGLHPNEKAQILIGDRIIESLNTLMN